MVGLTGKDVNEYTLSTGFDVSTASFVDSFSVSSQETAPVGITFNTDGTKMFVIGHSGATVDEYTLSTGFDVSTASYDSSFSVSSQERYPSSVTFSNDGKKMFVIGINDDEVNEYSLSTGFDVSTASFVGNFSVSPGVPAPNCLAFNNDGTKMFVGDHLGKDINEYTLTTPFSLVDVSGEHTGDVIDTSSTSNKDSDVDGDTLTVTQIKKSGGSNSAVSSGTTNTNGTSVTGTYGVLTIGADGSYTYEANQAAADLLDATDEVNDVFEYTVSDGNDGTDTANITIKVIGINDVPVAQDDVGVIVEGSTLTVANSANANESGGTYDSTGEHTGLSLIHI